MAGGQTNSQSVHTPVNTKVHAQTHTGKKRKLSERSPEGPQTSSSYKGKCPTQWPFSKYKPELDAARHAAENGFKAEQGDVKELRSHLGLVVVHHWFPDDPNWGWFTKSIVPAKVEKHLLQGLVEYIDELTGVHASFKKVILKAWQDLQ